MRRVTRRTRTKFLLVKKVKRRRMSIWEMDKMGRRRCEKRRKEGDEMGSGWYLREERRGKKDLGERACPPKREGSY